MIAFGVRGRARVARVGPLSLPAATAVGDAGGDRVGDRVVDRGVDAAAEAHVRHGRLDGSFAGDPVDAGDDLRGGAAAGVVEHPDADQLYSLRHAERGAADRTGDVGAVAVAVIGAAAVDGIESARGPAAEVVVGEPDTGVDDVRAHAVAVVGYV